jgi:drug/metabolite transporter (DMT)-like permease
VLYGSKAISRSKHIKNCVPVSRLQITFMEKIMWRVLFWSGLLLVILGAPLASYTIVYVNTDTTVHPHLVMGVALIILGAVVMTAGYFVSQGRIRIRRNKIEP